MKVIYSLKEFHSRVCEITGEDPRHVRVNAQFGLFDKIEFSCYTDGLREIFDGKTMEDCLMKVQDRVSPPPKAKADIDVEIEMPEEKEVEDAKEA